MVNKNFSHKITINEKRRENKRASDVSGKVVSKKAVRNVFENYYKDQVRALYRAVVGE